VFSSLRTRLWLSYALMIATALVVVAVVLLLYLIRNPLLYRQTLNRLQTAEGLILQRPRETLNARNSTALERITQTLDVRVLVFEPGGGLRLDTEPTQPDIPLPRRRVLPRVVPSAEDVDGGFWLYTLNRLPDGDWLLVTAPRPRVPLLNVFTDELLIPLSQGALVALALSLVLAFLFSRWIADPLQRVVTAARGFPSEAIQAVPERGPREVQDLTRAFNAMVARVQAGRQSQREFVANVSHELKTPLTSIQGFAQAILDETAHTPEARDQAAHVIYSEAGRMHRMVLSLLDLARMEGGTADFNMAPVDVNALLKGITDRFGPQAGQAGVTLGLDLPLQLPVLIGDGDRLAQVFTNLLDNALKFTPTGGRIVLRASQIGDEIRFEVQDTGQGIPVDALDRLFDRFYQVDASRPGGAGHGAGLGLAIAREIVQAHGGRITVRSQPGQGATFIIDLPLVQPAVTTLVHRNR
jgi:two-component system OmpR family sensor kinase